MQKLLREFQRGNTHMAIVTDEFGGVSGLVTIEDALEEIVGEITDEFDVREQQAIEPQADGRYLVDGTLAIRTLNRALDWTLPDAEANTGAGLVIHAMGRLPATGEHADVHGWRFEVVDLDGRRIDKILASRLTYGT